jgi:protein O-GlcNAc transferase
MKIGFVNFTPLIYDVETPFHQPLGGSESGMCYLAIELAKNGHDVTLFVHQDKDFTQFTQRGVRHESIQNLGDINTKKLDYLVLQNTPNHGPEVKKLIGKKTKLIFWTGHGPKQNAVADLKDPEVREVFDKFVYVGTWQQEGHVEAFGVDPAKCVIMKNAISPAFANLFQKEESILSYKDNPPTLVYTSTPYMGLNEMLNIFPEIRRAVPGTTLKVYGSMQVYQMPVNQDQSENAELYKRCRETEGVIYVGSLPQPKLALELKKALILTYPNSHPETSSICVMEAMAAGCLLVTSNFGGIPQTAAGFGSLITIPTKPEKVPNYEQHFAEETVKLLQSYYTNPNLLEKHLSKQIKYFNDNHNWSVIAKKWEKEILI